MLLYETETDPTLSGGTPVFHEDICCIYIDLDRLIDTCGLTQQQMFIVKEVMKGYQMADIAREFNIHRQSVDASMRSAVEKIVRQNDLNWAEWASKQKEK
jgi:DNA-binding CsgD family transcriptional regulator